VSYIMACRICLEDCDEPAVCACNAFVHAECVDKWIRISKRRTCEVCLTPFHGDVEYRPARSNAQVFGCGNHEYIWFIVWLITFLSAVYFSLLLFFQNWYIVFCGASTCRVVCLLWLIPFRHTVHIENVWFWWQIANCLVVSVARIQTYDVPLTEEQRNNRLVVFYLVYMELLFLLVVFAVRGVVRRCRACMQPTVTTFPDTLDTTSDL
jgi:hypothetical protein